MKFYSTRKSSPEISFSEAIQQGLAPDGGLYVPEVFPKIDLSGIKNPSDILLPFLSGDILEDSIHDICAKALNFPTPTVKLNDSTQILELFHGPTCAFKDYGARFLAESLQQLANKDPQLKKTILVATSGDTGGAVASAFYQKSNFDVVILFPHQGVSKRQEKQLTCWGENITSYAVEGDFDTCQKMVKHKLSFEKEKYSSANSINIGRLLPQMTYYAIASLQNPGVNFIVPTGNMGNVVAAFWAKRMGFPIGKINIATNANSTISQFFESGNYQSQKTINTIANAMDVGNPSNIERLFDLYLDIKELKKTTEVLSVSDDQIKETIIQTHRDFGYIPCPHTATALYFKSKLTGNWMITATAHPAKFETVIEPLINKTLEVPNSLKKLLEKESHFKVIKEFK